jgi:hypothetical protein
MADKKLNEVPVVSDIVTIFGKRSNGEIVQIDKSNLATLLGGLIGNTYSSFTLAKGEETLIATGTGVYYISNTYLDSVSSLIVINYDDPFILGEKDYRIKYRVQESKLYATALLGEEYVRVRNIAHK